jgi:pyrimidine deaminase RibD-like protein
MTDLSRVHLEVWHDIPRHPKLRSNRDLRWLARAAKVAEMADGRWRVGCVLVRSGRVLAAAANSMRNDPMVCGDELWLSSEHAEVAALRLAGDATGATAYVARIGSDGSWRHAQPCLRCQHWLDKYSVHSVWTSDQSYIESVAARGKIGTRSLPKKP